MEFDQAKENLATLIESLPSISSSANEAETRLKIIDELIFDCFDWAKEDVRVEVAQGQEYSDYELGRPLGAIWEAKKVSKTFDVPTTKRPSLYRSLESMVQMSSACAEAVHQVNQYCLNRGSELAVATNGTQIIAFRASRTASAKQRTCLVFQSLEHLLDNFSIAWESLSSAAVGKALLLQKLDSYGAPQPPEKISASIPNYPQNRTPSNLHSSTLDIAELLLLNVDDQPEIEERFYTSCYCQSGALNQHSLISKNMLNARYASLFSDAEDAPIPSPVSGKRANDSLTPEVLTDAISNRPIALVGDVGVGKTSFLKHLMYVSAFREFQKAIYIYVDLGRRGALYENVRELVLDTIENSLLKSHEIDVRNADFVFAVYAEEIARFDNSIWGRKKITDPDKYEDKLYEELDRLQSARSEHLKRSISHISRTQKKQVIIAIDNADQRNLSVQQDAFIISQNLASDWRATVFISVRPKTFYYSKRSGALSAYPHRMFTISPPRVDEVITKRLKFAIQIANGKVPLEKLTAISIQLDGIASLLRIFLDAVDRDTNIKIFLENITGGNIRELIQFIAGFFGNPNVDLRLIVDTLQQGEDFILPIHELWKVALKGDNQYFDSDRAIAMNIFDVVTDNENELFLCSFILGLLNQDHPRRNGEGFVDREKIREELQGLGFTESAVSISLLRLTNKKLVETPERVTFEEDVDGLIGENRTAFRITTLGAYHFRVWMTTFSYLDAVCIDTPIFDSDVSESILRDARSSALRARYERARAFKIYLTNVWQKSGFKTNFFDWSAACKDGDLSFEKVSKALARR